MVILLFDVRYPLDMEIMESILLRALTKVSGPVIFCVSIP